jgi:hypothetical protein
LRGDVVVDVSAQVDSIVAMLACHKSQVFEWLPYNRGILEQIPSDKLERSRWLDRWYRDYLRPQADRYRDELIAVYGPARGAAIEYAEVFEVSEYAAPWDDATRRRLFPFVP